MNNRSQSDILEESLRKIKILLSNIKSIGYCLLFSSAVVMDAALLGCNDTAISKKEKVWQRERMLGIYHYTMYLRHSVIRLDYIISCGVLWSLDTVHHVL